MEMNERKGGWVEGEFMQSLPGEEGRRELGMEEEVTGKYGG